MSKYRNILSLLRESNRCIIFFVANEVKNNNSKYSINSHVVHRDNSNRTPFEVIRYVLGQIDILSNCFAYVARCDLEQPISRLLVWYSCVRAEWGAVVVQHWHPFYAGARGWSASPWY
jgi:hypothetical protein